MSLPVTHADVVVDRIAGNVRPGVALGDVAPGLSDHNCELALPIDLVRDLRPDHRLVVANLGAPDAQEDRWKFGCGYRRPIVPVAVVAQDADDLLRPRNQRQESYGGEPWACCFGSDDVVAAGKLGARDKIRERRIVRQGRAEIHHGVCDHRTPAFPSVFGKRQQLHGSAWLARCSLCEGFGHGNVQFLRERRQP